MRAGTLQGHKIDRQAFEEGKLLYYGMFGWDADGRPTQAKLEELNVGWIWERLQAERESQKVYAI
jgi:aldehyde:ferredoxin oxidoreductase